MPTKLGKGGHGPQEYVPEGNGKASGTYADDSGVNIYGSFKTFKKPNDPSGTGTTTEKVESKDKTEEKDFGLTPNKEKRKQKYKSFDDYCDSQHNNEFGDNLKQQFSKGTEEGKQLVDKLVSNGIVKVRETNGGAYYDGAVVLGKEKPEGQYSCHREGETLYHEFWHAFDEFYAKGFVDSEGKSIVDKQITDEENERLTKRSFFDYFVLSRNLSSAKVLSNGKTLLETLKDEGKQLSKSKGWEKLQQDYNQEIEDKVASRYSNANELQTKLNDMYREIDNKARELYPSYVNGQYDDDYWDKRNKYKEQQQTLPEYVELQNKVREIQRERSKITSEITKKGWMHISDMYGIYKGVGYGFCGGHPANYGKKNKGAMGNEFLAEYGSAYSRGDKEQMELFKKYFPEGSKMCEEIISLVSNLAKGI